MKNLVLIYSKTFKQRAKVIADQAHNPRGALGEGADFNKGMDEEERRCEFTSHLILSRSRLIA